METKQCPNYLKEYKELWEKDPKEANLAWWSKARFGLMLHYGLYSFMGDATEWVQLRKVIPVDEYEQISNAFTAHNFDAEKITDLAVAAGMNYVNLVTCHHDGFCLWDSKAESFNSVNAPCGRNLVRELADACDRKGLGFFTYYTFAQNWRHPYFIDNTVFQYARPDYEERPKEYLYEKPEDLKIYVEYIEKCIEELLLDCGTTAGIWFDLILAYYPLRDHGYFDVEAIYDKVRKIRPDVLLSWKQGATGTEDFATPEQHFHSLEGSIGNRFGEEAALHHRKIWEVNSKKHNEICATLQKKGWSFNCFTTNRNASECYELLGHAAQHNANLLLNVSPLGDGSISPVQEEILRKLGNMIREKGYPEKGDIKLFETGLPE